MSRRPAAAMSPVRPGPPQGMFTPFCRPPDMCGRLIHPHIAPIMLSSIRNRRHRSSLVLLIGHAFPVIEQVGRSSENVYRAPLSRS